MRRPLALILSLVAPATHAQEPDWAIIRQPDEQQTVAYVELTAGLTVGFRCADGAFGAILAGLPEAPGDEDFRTLRLRIRDRPERDTRWAVTRDRTGAIAEFPASLAREFRQGGGVSLMVPGGAEGGRNLRYNITLPASAAAIDETLTTCGKPLVDPRDERLPDIVSDNLPDGMNWSRPPRPRHPNNFYAAGYAVVSCVIQPDGRVDDCEVESEFPLDGRYGRNALAAMDDARVVSPGEIPGQYAPRMIGFRVNYRQ
jgi:hypothetical protein